MVFEVTAISAAFLFGLLARACSMPPLVGFLAAGFAINIYGSNFEIDPHTTIILNYLADFGVLILLFTVGLKLKLRQIGTVPVIGGSILHFVLVIAIFAPLVWLLFTQDSQTALIVAIALSFSSTVLTAKLLEAKREMGVFYGRTAIGILIIQDILALVVLAIFAGKLPGPWALLVCALPLLRPVLYYFLDKAGHDEVLVLIGMLLSLVLGGAGFEAIGLKGEIGALVIGLMLSGHPKASELSNSLWSLKEVFLVGFFLSIGMSGLPDLAAIGFAITLVALLPVKAALFFGILVALRLRARTAFLTALSLSAYSEFGLIVAAGIPAAAPYLVPLALAVAFSFVVAAPLNRYAHTIYENFGGFLNRFESPQQHPDDVRVDLGDANVLVFGMGRTGTAAYHALSTSGLIPVGIDADTFKARSHQNEGRQVVFADVEDRDFWIHVEIDEIKAVILAMDNVDAKLIATRNMRMQGFQGPIISHAFYEDQAKQIEEAGADQTHLTMREAGRSLAAHAIAALIEREKQDVPSRQRTTPS